MDTDERRAAFMSAMTTEHVVMQTVIGVTISESGQRASIYMVSLSSSLVAMGFVAQSPGAFVPFVATVLPAVFVLGIFTIMRMSISPRRTCWRISALHASAHITARSMPKRRNILPPSVAAGRSWLPASRRCARDR